VSDFRTIFNNLDKLCDKWDPYFDVYEKHFRKFVGKSPKILEIGIYKGGSAEMWLKYFGEGTTIVGVDINPECKQYATPDFEVVIGDAGDLMFWNKFQLFPNDYDIIIDDGGHHMDQQIFTLQKTWNSLKPGGVYLCEDTHTSYWDHWPNAGYQKPSSFIEYSKGIIDGLHADHTTKGPDGETFVGPKIKRPIGSQVAGISFYDSMVVIDKKLEDKPFKRVFSHVQEVEPPKTEDTKDLNIISGDAILSIRTK